MKIRRIPALHDGRAVILSAVGLRARRNFSRPVRQFFVYLTPALRTARARGSQRSAERMIRTIAQVVDTHPSGVRERVRNSLSFLDFPNMKQT